MIAYTIETRECARTPRSIAMVVAKQTLEDLRNVLARHVNAPVSELSLVQLEELRAELKQHFQHDSAHPPKCAHDADEKVIDFSKHR